jgi:NitT/TauT family transport system substrate-binding protein
MEAIRMKGVLSLLALILVFGLLAEGCTPKKAKEKTPIKIALDVWPGYAHAFIAQEKGIFKRHRVDVELILKKDVAESTQLFINNAVDGFFNIFPDIILMNVQGIHSKVVYVTGYSDTGDVIIGKPKFRFLADLKGRKVSFEGINTFSHIFVLKSLEKVGLKESEVQFGNIPAMDVLNSLEKGMIDAGHTWEPIKSQALKKGYKILAKAGDIPGIITDVLVFHAKVVKERPDDIQRIVESILEARDFIYSNRDEALEIMSRAEGMSKEEMGKGIDGVRQLDLKENIKEMQKSKEMISLYGSGKMIIDFYLSRGQLSQLPDLDEIIEPKFVIELSEKPKQ